MPNEIQPAVPEASEGSSRYQNVAESWPIYDTVVMCPQMFGPESSVRGWFTSFPQFAAQVSHSFLNQRTESVASLAYCNKQTADSMDFPYELRSIGVAFIAPSTRVLSHADAAGVTGLQIMNTQIAHWWETELPRHCSLELKVQQDVVLELPALVASPGYGPSGGGMSFEHEQPCRFLPNGSVNPDYMPVANMAVTQGVPSIQNRWDVLVEDPASGKMRPIGIPRTGTVEAIIRVSEIARWNLARLSFAPYYIFGGDDAADPQNYYHFPARFMIQVSLHGKRAVQQRAQYFA